MENRKLFSLLADLLPLVRKKRFPGIASTNSIADGKGTFLTLNTGTMNSR